MELNLSDLDKIVQQKLVAPFYQGSFSLNTNSMAFKAELAHQLIYINAVIETKAFFIEDISFNILPDETNYNFAMAKKTLRQIVGLAYKIGLSEISLNAASYGAYTFPKLGFLPSDEAWNAIAEQIIANARKIIPDELETVEKLVEKGPVAARIISFSKFAEKLLGNTKWQANLSFKYDKASYDYFNSYTASSAEEEKIINAYIRQHVDHVNELNEHLGV